MYLLFFHRKILIKLIRSRKTNIKDAINTTLVLTIPDFTKTLVLECDDLGRYLGVILMREGCPLAFTTKQLCDLNLEKSTYEK